MKHPYNGKENHDIGNAGVQGDCIAYQRKISIGIDGSGAKVDWRHEERSAGEQSTTRMRQNKKAADASGVATSTASPLRSKVKPFHSTNNHRNNENVNVGNASSPPKRHHPLKTMARTIRQRCQQSTKQSSASRKLSQAINDAAKFGASSIRKGRAGAKAAVMKASSSARKVRASAKAVTKKASSSVRQVNAEAKAAVASIRQVSTGTKAAVKKALSSIHQVSTGTKAAVKKALSSIHQVSTGTKAAVKKALSSIRQVMASLANMPSKIFEARKRKKLLRKLRMKIAHMKYMRLTKHAKKYLRSKQIKRRGSFVRYFIDGAINVVKDIFTSIRRFIGGAINAAKRCFDSVSGFIGSKEKNIKPNAGAPSKAPVSSSPTCKSKKKQQQRERRHRHAISSKREKQTVGAPKSTQRRQAQRDTSSFEVKDIFAADESRYKSIYEEGTKPEDDDFDGVWKQAYQDAMAKKSNFRGPAAEEDDEVDDSYLQILVKTNSGLTQVIDVEIGDTVNDLKAKISRRIHIPSSEQRLTFGTKQLEGKRTLADYNIQRESTIHLTCSLRGGASTNVSVSKPKSTAAGKRKSEGSSADDSVFELYDGCTRGDEENVDNAAEEVANANYNASKRPRRKAALHASNDSTRDDNENVENAAEEVANDNASKRTRRKAALRAEAALHASNGSTRDDNENVENAAEEVANDNASSKHGRSGYWRSKAGNYCNASRNGTAGLAHLAREESTDAAKVAADDDATKGGEDKEVKEGYDWFAGTDFKTNNETIVKEEDWVKLEKNAAATKKFLSDTAGDIVVQHGIDKLPCIPAITASILWSLDNGDIASLASNATGNATDPKSRRSSVDITAKDHISRDQPAGYSLTRTSTGKEIIGDLRDAVRDNSRVVGADETKTQCYSLMWKGSANKTKSTALVIGPHCDQHTQHDKDFWTARQVLANGPPFQLHLSLCVFYLDEDGKEHQHIICTVTEEMAGNDVYYLSHCGAGRGCVAQTTFKGRKAILVLKHQITVDTEHKNESRAAIMIDFVFQTKALHDKFLNMVNPTNSNHLPRRFGTKMIQLDRKLRQNASYTQFRQDLSSSVANTIKSMQPVPRDFVPQCANSNCSGTAAALSLVSMPGDNDGLHGPELLDHLRVFRNKDTLAARLVCSDCADTIQSEDDKVVNVCLECCLEQKLSKLMKCSGCGEYQCTGATRGGVRQWKCRPGGEALDNTNIRRSSHMAICKKCENGFFSAEALERLSNERRKKRNDIAGYDVDEKAKQQMRAIFQLKDPTVRLTIDKKYRKGENINWENATDKIGGFGALAGGTRITLNAFYQKFRTNAGKNINTVAQFDEYIAAGNKVGIAASGRKKKENH